jgi:hypothetical protein
VRECTDCQQLIDDWNEANATLRRMRRSAIVFDYSTQTSVVDARRAAYIAHQRAVHPLDPHDELGPPWRDARHQARSVTIRRVAPKLALGLAVGALFVVAFLLHGA